MPLSNISVLNNRVPDFAHPDDCELCRTHMLNLAWEYGVELDENRVVVSKLASNIFRSDIYLEGFKANLNVRYYYPEGVPDWANQFGRCPVICEFENAYCYSSIREAFSIRGFFKRSEKGQGGGKTQWGDLIAVHPFKEDSPFNGTFIQYRLKQSSPIYQKQVTRNEYKGILKRQGYPVTMVCDALQFNWKDTKRGTLKVPGFETNYREIGRAIHTLFDIDLKEFWQNCRNGNFNHVKTLSAKNRLAPEKLVPGYTKFPRPSKPQQMELFAVD